MRKVYVPLLAKWETNTGDTDLSRTPAIGVSFVTDRCVVVTFGNEEVFAIDPNNRFVEMDSPRLWFGRHEARFIDCFSRRVTLGGLDA